MENNIIDLVSKLNECREELKKMGAYGCDLFDGSSNHGHKQISIHMRKEDLPDGKVEYNTKIYNDYVIKNVFVGNVCFFALLSIDDANKEGVFWGPLI